MTGAPGDEPKRRPKPVNAAITAHLPERGNSHKLLYRSAYKREGVGDR